MSELSEYINRQRYLTILKHNQMDHQQFIKDLMNLPEVKVAIDQLKTAGHNIDLSSIFNAAISRAEGEIQNPTLSFVASIAVAMLADKIKAMGDAHKDSKQCIWRLIVAFGQHILSHPKASSAT